MESGDEYENHKKFETSGGFVHRCLHALADLAIRHMVSHRSRRQNGTGCDRLSNMRCSGQILWLPLERPYGPVSYTHLTLPTICSV